MITLYYIIVLVCLGLLIIFSNLIAIRINRWTDDFSTIRQQRLAKIKTSANRKRCVKSRLGILNGK